MSPSPFSPSPFILAHCFYVCPSLPLSPHSFSNHPSHWFPIPLSIPPSPHCLSPSPSVTYCFYLPRHPPIHPAPSAVPVTPLHLSPACPPFHSSWCSAQSSRLKGALFPPLHPQTRRGQMVPQLPSPPPGTSAPRFAPPTPAMRVSECVQVPCAPQHPPPHHHTWVSAPQLQGWEASP